MAELPLTRRVALAHQPFHGVLDLTTGQNLTLDEFIGEGDYGDLVEKKRLALEHDLLEERVRFVCQRCHKSMVLRSLAVEKDYENRCFLKHRYRSEECGGTKGMTHEGICALKYANTKESPAHKDYKALIEGSLAADPSFSGTKPEAAWFRMDGVRWRKPDVQTIRNSQRIALEVQLSTTFVEVVAQRQAFYRKNFGHLIWFFRALAIADFRQAKDDIFCSNNRNAFLITKETLALSQREGRMAMECAWLEPYLDGDDIEHTQHCQVVFFDQLKFEVSAIGAPRAYFFDYDASRAPLDVLLEARRPKPIVAELPPHDPLPPAVDYQSDPALCDLMEAFFRGFPNHVHNQEFWSVVRTRFQRRGFDLPEHVNFEPVFPVLQAAYSAKLGRPAGCEQRYLIELANTLFNSHKPALWVFSVIMSHYERGDLLRERGDRRAWSEKVRQYHQAWIDRDPDFLPEERFTHLLIFLFPEAATALRQSPVEYVASRRVHASLQELIDDEDYAALDWVSLVGKAGDGSAPWALTTKFFQRARQLEEEERHSESRAIQVLGGAISMHLRHPSHALFGPVFRSSEGRSMSMEDLGEHDVALLSRAAHDAPTPWIRARLADIAVTADGRTPPDWRLGLLAVDAYLDYIASVFGTEHAIRGLDELQRSLVLCWVDGEPPAMPKSQSRTSDPRPNRPIRRLRDHRRLARLFEKGV